MSWPERDSPYPYNDEGSLTDPEEWSEVDEDEDEEEEAPGDPGER